MGCPHVVRNGHGGKVQGAGFHLVACYGSPDRSGSWLTIFHLTYQEVWDRHARAAAPSWRRRSCDFPFRTWDKLVFVIPVAVTRSRSDCFPSWSHFSIRGRIEKKEDGIFIKKAKAFQKMAGFGWSIASGWTVSHGSCCLQMRKIWKMWMLFVHTLSFIMHPQLWQLEEGRMCVKKLWYLPQSHIGIFYRKPMRSQSGPERWTEELRRPSDPEPLWFLKSLCQYHHGSVPPLDSR